MADFLFPRHIEELDVATIDRLVSDAHPGAKVEAFEIVEARKLGKMVSTAGRVKMKLTYSSDSPPLPENALLKMIIEEQAAPGLIFQNEVNIYSRILPQIDIETPFFLGGTYDEGTDNFALLLEDLSLRNPVFPNALETFVDLDRVKTTLSLLAKIHAHFWNSESLVEAEKAGWLSSLVSGKQFEFFDPAVVPGIDERVAESPYRQSLIDRVGRTTAELWPLLKAVHRHNSKSPQTLLHGDTGVHNTYLLPDGSVGMLDWQMTVRGAWPHDVHYLLCTALDTEVRRKHERELVRFYLDQLAEYGVKDLPKLDDAMASYARAILWGFLIGWMMVPDVNYGPEIAKANLDRIVAAMEDLDTVKLAEAVV